MRTVYIICEGQTEEEFVKAVLAPYLKDHGIDNAVPILLETSPGYYGGGLTYERYKLNAQNLLLNDPHAVVTSLIDYYALYGDFPGFAEPAADAMTRATLIEQRIAADIGNPSLYPYIQLHEFEALLFSDIKAYNTYFPAQVSKVQYVIGKFANPEDINDSPETSPSKRLQSIFGKRRYTKTFHGPMIALENGIEPVLAKCPRFRKWAEQLVLKAVQP